MMLFGLTFSNSVSVAMVPSLIHDFDNLLLPVVNQLKRAKSISSFCCPVLFKNTSPLGLLEEKNMTSSGQNSYDFVVAS